MLALNAAGTALGVGLALLVVAIFLFAWFDEPKGAPMARERPLPPVRDVHVHFTVDNREVVAKLDQILAQLNQTEAALMADLSSLEAEVSQNGDAVASAVALLNGLSSQLKDALAANDPAAIQALVDQLDANTQTLADAVTANTPAAPAA